MWQALWTWDRQLKGRLPPRGFPLLDIGLPEMDGYEVARRLRTIVPRARLIAVTGYGLAQDKQRSADSGFEAHLVKPVNLADLETTFAALAT